MKKGIVLATVTIVSVSLFGCSPNLEKVKGDLNPTIEETSLNDYIDDIDKDVSYSYKEKANDNKEYKVDITVKVANSFNKLDRLGKFNLLSDVTQEIDNNTVYPECGSVDCDFGSLLIVADHNGSKEKYSMSVGHSGEPVMNYDGVSYKEEDFNYYTEDDSSTSVSGDNSYLADAVYEYMEQLFDEITDNGENYDPDIHDPQVTQAAADKFGITYKEASEMYVEKAVEEFQ